MATATQKARRAAVEWAVKIAKDNKYHYGRSKWAHHSGCPFCNTQGTKRKFAPKSQWDEVQYTYCCNPFVTAAYKHGAGAKSVDCKVKNKRINLANDPNPVFKTSEWKRINKPAKVTSLKVGDILLTPTHCMIYVGDGKVVHAAHHDNGKKGAYWNSSITVQTIPTKQWKRTTKIYRYVGKGRFKDDPKISNPYKVGQLYKAKRSVTIRKGAGKNTAKIGTLKTNATIKVIATKRDKNGSIWVKFSDKPVQWVCGINSKKVEYIGR